MKADFTIPLNGLKSGLNEFSWVIDKEFFEEFGNVDILDADIKAGARIVKTGTEFDVDCKASGTVTVSCDRCLEDLVLPVCMSALLAVRYGVEPDEPEDDQEGRELVYLPVEQAEYDMSQVLYDYICLSLPMQRHHRDGECNPEAFKYLSSENAEGQTSTTADSPFASLKGLFEEK